MTHRGTGATKAIRINSAGRGRFGGYWNQDGSGAVLNGMLDPCAVLDPVLTRADHPEASKLRRLFV